MLCSMLGAISGRAVLGHGVGSARADGRRINGSWSSRVCGGNDLVLDAKVFMNGNMFRCITPYVADKSDSGEVEGFV